MLILLAFIWGSSFILMKKGLEEYNHTTVAALRVTIASIFLLPFAFKYFASIEKKHWKYIIISGILGNGIPAFLFTLAQTKIPSSISGILNSLTPIFALIIGVLIFKRKTNYSNIAGVLIGLSGAIGLILSEGINLKNSNLSYSIFIIIATICYAFTVNIIKTYLKEVNSIAITALAFLSIGPITMIYLIFGTSFFQNLGHTVSFLPLFQISILAIVGTALSVILFNILIKKVSTLFATSVTYLIPAFAIIWGVIDGESITFIHIICLSITLLGIYFINKF